MGARSDDYVEHLSTILCLRAERGEHGALNAIGLMDMLAIENLPSEPVVVGVSFVILSNWRRNKEPGCKVLQRIVLERDDDKTRVTLTAPQEVDLSQVHLSCLITEARQIPLRGYGQYFLVVQRQGVDGDWEDALPAAGLWVTRPPIPQSQRAPGP